ncbi:DedA family protein [Pseudonocardia bannensis]|uniref:DedA family protein n=1 Tax=Pseudonocardia bannensis TaxID=630973 RepID=A0A848DDE3_9PSEU|nr:VTT domain-containing protein [Pseudonocardia bannensis]NMH90629.1 DedA family protein [Pseudonocardia bannensis]
MPLPVAPIAAYLALLVWSSVPFAPAEPFLLAAGSYAASGPLSLWIAIVAAAAGSFASDLAKYALGRVAGAALLRRLRRRPAGARAVAWIEARVLRAGPAAIAPSYFVPFGVVAATVLCGALRMPVRGVALASACGAVLWSSAFLLLGYAGGALTGNPLIGSAVAVPAAVLIGLLVRKRTTDRVGPTTGSPEPALTGGVSGPGPR